MTRNPSHWVRAALVGLSVGLVGLAGCPGPKDDGGKSAPPGAADRGKPAQPAVPERTGTAKAEDVDAAKKLLDGFGADARYKLLPGGVMTEVVVQDGSNLTAENIALFGKLSDLEKLQIYNFRGLNDEMVAQLDGLTKLTTLALTNSVIGDKGVQTIVEAFPNLTDLDLSSNTNMTNGVLKVICTLGKLERLTLVQNNFNDLGTSHLEKLTELRALDLRGNMEAGDMTLEIVGVLPKLAAFKHRSTAVTDYGMELLAECQTLDSLLMQDFAVTDQAGPWIAKLPKLTQLEVVRCQGFGSEGVLALKGMNLTRLTLRDLPSVDDRGMEVFTGLSKLKRLFLHELTSVSDEGLKSLGSLQELEELDIWTVPNMTDATLDVIATLPKLKVLSIRTTGVTDAAADKLLAMPSLQSLTFKENGAVTDAAIQKLSAKKWSKLEVGK